MTGRPTRRLPVGAEVLLGGGVHFRVWAPARRTLEVVWEGPAAARPAASLRRERGGYFSGRVAAAAAGDLYKLRLDGGPAFPDPASRFQPEGPHGPSRVVDPSTFAWSDGSWRGAGRRGQVMYELHVGTFSAKGTFRAAERELPELAALGITMIELMPVAEFAGRYGWGYDGVDLFAPFHHYGEPDELRRFVDRAHALGLGVILDVVYNHLGPAGNYLAQFSPGYFTDRHANEWGETIRFDGAPAVRELFWANAVHWVVEYHLDGLRLDATDAIHDRSPEHVLAELGRRVRQAAAALPPGRSVYLAAENDAQQVRLLAPRAEDGCDLDALWNDDFHHAGRVALSGRAEAYYSDYRGTPQELISAVKHGFLYQGQRSCWRSRLRGTPALGLPGERFIAYLDNHDQIANSARGERCHRLGSPGRYRALTALLLLGPATPLLFQGQEFCASSPFLFFADHEPELARAVRRGRARSLAQFPSLASAAARRALPDPGDPATYERSRLDLSERGRHAAAVALHRDLLALRRGDPVFRLQGGGGIDGAVLGAEALVLRFFAGAAERAAGAGDRLLLINLGRDLELVPAPEPLLAPPAGMRWSTLWSSEAPRYGGSGGRPAEDGGGGWRLAGQAAEVLAAVSDPAGCADAEG